MPRDSITHHSLESNVSSSDSGIIVPVTLTIVLLSCFLICLFSLYCCRYIASSVWRHRRNLAAGVSPRPPGLDPTRLGLDPSLIASFPTFTYSWVKNLQERKYGLECAVCLGEFEDNDVLRLLTPCNHVFHAGCIDLWLKYHTTCPVCRHELRPQEEAQEVRILVIGADDLQGGADESRGEEGEQQRRFSFKEDEEGGGDDADGNGEDERRRSINSDLDRLPRWNSTGHSSEGTDDRFTLRLPDDVKARITRERNWTRSCINFRDLLGDVHRMKDDDDDVAGGSVFSDRGPCRT